MFPVVALFALVLVLATHAVGSRFGSRVGVGSALLAAVSPVVLHQLVEPVSELPAAALWILAVAWITGQRPQHVVLAGLATSGAILFGPHFLPLALVIGLFALLRPERPWRRRVRDAAVYVAASTPGYLVVALIHLLSDGTQLASAPGEPWLFAWGQTGADLQSMLLWIWSSHTPFIALAALSPLLLSGGVSFLVLGMFAVNVALPTPPAAAEDWTSLRVLLPSIPLLIVLAVASCDAAITRVLRTGLSPASPRQRAIGAAALMSIAIAVAIAFVFEARERDVFTGSSDGSGPDLRRSALAEYAR